jgi:hypothetical protein
VKGNGDKKYANNSMYDFASHITAGEKLPSLAFGFKSFDTTVLKHRPSVPESVKLAVGCGIYSVVGIFIFLGHGNAVPNWQSVPKKDAPLISFSASFCSQPLDDGETFPVRL